MEKLHTNKFILCFLLAAIAFIIMLSFFMSWHEMRISTIDIDNIPVLTNEESFVCFDISDVLINKNNSQNLTIAGWAIIRGRETMPAAIHVLLKEISTNKVLELPTSPVERKDVTEYINDGINYDNSGFNVNIFSTQLNIGNGTHELSILYEIGDEKYILTTGEQNLQLKVSEEQ